ncbi:hypothetical protein [Winslowiella iniecta]|uniref:Uncharacterized protein n=1 Tax=Winslowiella iniecta TaxID=1560201 RepID=A0A0L7TGJ4_9GAMM|nr:hypothetical protein [Winslowiella iniecta]KOC91571.1 hypothetical protein NG42_04830 [Winslowiella iniecta]KOC94477.1 hypothetical protein NG43_04670 [Winslowiella iniecta]
MFKLVRSLFSSPEKLLQVLNRSDIEESIADGERIIIDEDGNATVNILSEEVQHDFNEHVNALKRA